MKHYKCVPHVDHNQVNKVFEENEGWLLRDVLRAGDEKVTLIFETPKVTMEPLSAVTEPMLGQSE